MIFPVSNFIFTYAEIFIVASNKIRLSGSLYTAELTSLGGQDW